MNTIFKYPIRLSGTAMAMPKHQEIKLQMPEKAHILTAQIQGDELVLWAEVNPNNEVEERVIEIVGTGGPLSDFKTRAEADLHRHLSTGLVCRAYIPITMNLGDTLRAMVEEHFPEHISRSVTYSAKEAELQVKFNANKKGLPDAQRVGWLVAETMRQMQALNYSKFGQIWTSVEAGIKMTITIKARTNSKHATQYDTTGADT